MTTREYMNRPFELKRQIRIKTSQLQGIRNLINGTSVVISEIPHSDSPDPHRLESLLAQSLDLELEIKKMDEDLAKATAEVTTAINSINNPSCEEVLTARYLNFKDWTTIARELDYCKDWIFRLHRKGLNLVRIA
ncbi:MAG: hypothetical protein J5744_08965 [Oscillospiraceae bacterium]|nr:hypothetical protein [Oscillospiraceae bacterium]